MHFTLLYHESISKPYAPHIRGLINENKNALDIGPLHYDLEAHCNTIIKRPTLLIGNSTSYTTGSFYGTPWDQPFIDIILSHQNNFPHLNNTLIVFFKGAHHKWSAFTEELKPGAEISQLTAKKRHWRSVLQPTTTTKGQEQ